MFDAALAAKADAVYLAGTKFGARAYANNFDTEQLNILVKRAHLSGVKVYLAVNTLVKDTEFKDLYDYLTELAQINVDGLIIQDLGVYQFIKEYFIGFELHSSTQMALNNLNGAKFIEKLGFERVVVGREVSLDEISLIKKETSLDIEAFIHGSLCVSVSGQCLVSSLIGQRSGNRGRCAQPCRKTFNLLHKGRPISKVADTFMSARDLMTLDEINKMIQAGVYSLKIEGRMKKPEYVYSVIKEYQKAIEKEYYDKDQLAYVSNRDFTKGLFNGDFGRTYFDSSLAKKGVIVGQISNKKNTQIIANRNLDKGDVIVVETVKGKMLNLTLKESIQVNQPFNLNGFKDLKDGSDIYKIFSAAVVENLNNDKEAHDTRPISIKVIAKLGKALEASAIYDDFSVNKVSDYIVDKAQNKDTSYKDIQKQMNRLGNTNYHLDKLEVIKDANIFIAKSKLNELRRDLIAFLDEKRLERPKIQIKEYKELNYKKAEKKDYKLTYEYYHSRNKEIDLNKFYRVYCHKPEDLSELRSMYEGQIYFVFPRIMYQKDYDILGEKLADKIDLIDGFACNSLGDIEFANSYNKPIHAESNLNIFNSYSIDFFKGKNINDISISQELNLEELANLNLGQIQAEVIAYGRLGQMLLKHCPASIIKGCEDDSQCETCPFGKDLVLKNKKDTLPLTRAYGYSEVLTDKAINIVNLKDEFDKTGISLLRVVDREEKDLLQQINYLEEVYINNKKLDHKVNAYTGHYKMGVV